MELLLPTKSLIYETLIDFRDEPKIVMYGLIAGSSTFLYISGYGPVGIVVYTFLFYECLFRLLFLLWIAVHLL